MTQVVSPLLLSTVYHHDNRTRDPLSPAHSFPSLLLPRLSYRRAAAQLEKAHMIVDDMVINGCVVETNKNTILASIAVLDKT
jgi:hypothetical protein